VFSMWREVEKTLLGGSNSVKELFAIIVLLISLAGCRGQPQYTLVSREYNFSAVMPGRPTEKTTLNDEGLPQKEWTFESGYVAGTRRYYHVTVTDYKEILRPEEEFVQNPALLALNGIRQDTFEQRTLATKSGRTLPAVYSSSYEIATHNTVISLFVIDGHRMFTLACRLNTNDAGQNALFLASFVVIE